MCRSKSFAASAGGRESFDNHGATLPSPVHLPIPPAAAKRSTSFADSSIEGVPGLSESALVGGVMLSEEKSAAPASLWYVPPALPPTGGKAPDNATAADADADAMQGGYAARAVIAPGIYFFGIVDILQTWSIDKIMEK